MIIDNKSILQDNTLHMNEVEMDKKIKPILVTGSHRSGSTWVGQMLATAPHIAYIQEPFNIGINIGTIPTILPLWFQNITDKEAELYKSIFEDLMQYKYPLINNINKTKSLRHAAQIVKGQGLFLWYKMNNRIPLLKDPIAIFSAEWLSATFDMNVVVLIRHPAAFCSSLKIKDLQFDFSNLQQESLINGRLLKYKDEIQEYSTNKKDLIDQAILLWNIIHHTINIYKSKHPEWIFVRHEDLSKNPIDEFQDLYNKLNLQFTDTVKTRILKSTGNHNPVEQKSKNEFVRDSKKNIYNWKKRLTKQEIDYIKDETSEIAPLFYSETEW